MIFGNAHIVQMICRRLAVADVVVLMRTCRDIGAIMRPLVAMQTRNNIINHTTCIAHRVTTILPRLDLIVRDDMIIKSKYIMRVTGYEIGTFACDHVGILKFNISKYACYMITTDGCADRCVISYGFTMHKITMRERITLDKLINIMIEYIILVYDLEERGLARIPMERYMHAGTSIHIYYTSEIYTPSRMADICQGILEQ